MARDEKIVIRVTEDIKQRFQDAADGMGMTISALGSYVLGDYLRRLENEKAFQEKMVGPTVETMIKMAGSSLDDRKLSQFVDSFASRFVNEQKPNGDLE